MLQDVADRNRLQPSWLRRVQRSRKRQNVFHHGGELFCVAKNEPQVALDCGRLRDHLFEEVERCAANRRQGRTEVMRYARGEAKLHVRKTPGSAGKSHQHPGSATQ